MSLTLLLISILGLYHLINLWRLLKHRVQADYLRLSFWRTFLWLGGLQLVIVLIYELVSANNTSVLTCLYVLTGLQLAGACLVAMATVRNLRKTAPTGLKLLTDHTLPTLTVAVPARNETDDLEACLRSLTASTYPKLEILVLDDCSQNKRTPAIIKAFAQTGVRFVSGKVPPTGWLAKNYAYRQLAEQANGDLLLFCGVDTRFEPDSLGELVSTLLQRDKTMLSLMPRNVPKKRLGLRQLLIQPNRYAWEVCLPRHLAKRPPVLSTCWLIKREALRKAGGFEAVRRSILPEGYLARYCAASGNGYLFLQADQAVGVTSHKAAQDQQDTSLRMRYPQLHRRPELVALVSLAELALFVWPPIGMLIAAATQFWTLAGLSAGVFAITTLTHSEIINLTYRRFVLRGLVLLPIAAIYDVWLLNYSMWQYEFGEVIWKGRNVCIPVMRINPN